VTFSKWAMVAALALLTLGTARPAKAVVGCETVRGRLEIWNGAPTYRIWVVGTKRVLGLKGVGEDMNKLPTEVARLWRRPADGPFGYRILGDFRVCAITEQRPGEMQFVHLEGGQRMRLLGPDED